MDGDFARRPHVMTMDVERSERHEDEEQRFYLVSKVPCSAAKPTSVFFAHRNREHSR